MNCLWRFSFTLALLRLTFTPGAYAGPTSDTPPVASNYLMKLAGQEESTLEPIPGAETVRDATTYDTIIVGGGLSGMVAALYLVDHGRKVLVLDGEPTRVMRQPQGFTHDERRDREASIAALD